MIIVTGTFRIPHENLEIVQPAMARVVKACCNEDGCLAYSYAADVVEPGLFRVFEAWRDHAALERHFRSDHMRIWSQARDKLGFFDRDISAHEVSSSTQI